jgi:putative acetyltransferase
MTAKNIGNLLIAPARSRRVRAGAGVPMTSRAAADVRISPALKPAEIDAARRLFREYAAGLGFDLAFQGFGAELAALPGDYAPPRGALLLARAGAAAGDRAAEASRNPAPESFAGCVALRPLGDTLCEMKRLFVRPAWRGTGLGRRLAEAILDEGRRLGYARMRLDTVPVMQSAIALYESLGFRDIPAYRHNPILGTRYLELSLAPPLNSRS